MSKQNAQPLTTLLLTFICTLSLLFTSLAASPNEGIIPEEEASEVSCVILVGASRNAAETDESTDESTTITVGTAPANFATGQWIHPSGIPDAQKAGQEIWKQGQSLGNFTTTGYCNCGKCSGGHSLTYSGTVPKANHTISADLDRFPIGTKLMINGVVYTVEDMGSSVDGRWLDIYYDEHSQAVAHGMKTEEVFTIIESNTP